MGSGEPADVVPRVTLAGMESWSKIVEMNIASELWNRIEASSSGGTAAGQASEANPATFY